MCWSLPVFRVASFRSRSCPSGVAVESVENMTHSIVKEMCLVRLHKNKCVCVCVCVRVCVRVCK